MCPVRCLCHVRCLRYQRYVHCLRYLRYLRYLHYLRHTQASLVGPVPPCGPHTRLLYPLWGLLLRQRRVHLRAAVQRLTARPDCVRFAMVTAARPSLRVLLLLRVIAAIVAQSLSDIALRPYAAPRVDLCLSLDCA